MNIIATDCTGEKLLALQFAARKIFNHEFKIVSTEKRVEKSPTTFEELQDAAEERITCIANSIDSNKYQKDTVYYATLQKGFIPKKVLLILLLPMHFLQKHVEPGPQERLSG